MSSLSDSAIKPCRRCPSPLSRDAIVYINFSLAPTPTIVAVPDDATRDLAENGYAATVIAAEAGRRGRTSRKTRKSRDREEPE